MSAFHSKHLGNAETRARFRLLLQIQEPPRSGSVPLEPQHAMDDVARWQAENGFHYLTPEAIEIFEHSRKFKEQQMAMQRADDARSATEDHSDTIDEGEDDSDTAKEHKEDSFARDQLALLTKIRETALQVREPQLDYG